MRVFSSPLNPFSGQDALLVVVPSSTGSPWCRLLVVLKQRGTMLSTPLPGPEGLTGG